MTAQKRLAFEQRCRDQLAHADERLETLRSAVERRASGDREDLERQLDDLRGLRNRLLARIEAARQAADGSWPFARAQADQSVSDLAAGLDALETRLRRAAA